MHCFKTFLFGAGFSSLYRIDKSVSFGVCKGAMNCQSSYLTVISYANFSEVNVYSICMKGKILLKVIRIVLNMSKASSNKSIHI